ncbi:MAG TPA: DUF1559 domain-containing protein [Pirellulales bacterium]|nr:DUF1559 domain-containing protein [Pirellulales bacterium]
MTRANWKTVLAAMFVACTWAGTALASPFCLVPLPPDPALQSVAPEECLFYYAWNGAATPDAKSKNQTEQLLAEEEVRRFVSAVESELVGLLQRSTQGDPQAQALGQSLPGLLKTLLTRPTTIYVGKVGMGQFGVDVKAALVVHTGPDAQKVAATVTQLEGQLAAQLPPQIKLQDLTVGTAKLRTVPLGPIAPALAWGFKGEYFMVAVGQGTADEIVGKLDGKTTTTAGWLQKLNQQLPVERPSNVGYINVAGIIAAATPMLTNPQTGGPDPAVGATLEALGLKQVQSIGWISGLDGTGMSSKTLISTQGEPTGIFAALAAKPLAASDLNAIPRDAASGVALRLDLADIYQRVISGIGKVNEQARNDALASVQGFEAQAGFQLLTDVFQPLGDVWCFYSMPQAPRAAATVTHAPAPLPDGAPSPDASPLAGLSQLTGTAIVVSVRDRKRLEATHQKLLAKAREALAEQGGQTTIKDSKFKGTQVYYIKNEDPQAMPIAPAWCLTEDRLVIAIDPNTLKDFLKRDASAKSLADRPEAGNWFATSDAPSIFVFQEMAASLRAAYPQLQQTLSQLTAALTSQGIRIPPLPALSAIEPHALPSLFAVKRTSAGVMIEVRESIPYIGSQSTATGGIVAALLLPAVQAAREAARRTQSANNLKQIGLAFHNFHDVYGQFPTAAGYSREGKPVLSWRVYLLPYVDAQALYAEFHLDEPWDSEHNKKLIARMPAIYQNPNLPAASEGKTNYLALTGEGGVFDVKNLPKPGLRDITDGSSNTIIVVEAAADPAVVWTKPDDVPFDPMNPLAGLTGLRPGIFQALFADGHVQAIKDTVAPAVMKALFTRAGNEPIAPDAY